MASVRKGEVFLRNRGERLGDYGYVTDATPVERTESGGYVFYHYTRPEHLEQIFAPDSGLRARLPIVDGEIFPDLQGRYLLEGFLDALPRWIADSPYFGDFGLTMMREYVGNLLLRVEVPADFPGLYIADLAHVFEVKHFQLRGSAPLDLGYNCETGHEAMLALVHSYIPLADYRGGYVAPNVKATRIDPGIAIPHEFVSICEQQPFSDL